MSAEQVQVPSTPRRSWLPRAHPISWWMLLITTLAILMTSVDGQILPTVLPAILKDYHLSDVQGGLLNSVFFFGIIAGAIFFGFISDVFGTGYRRGWTWIIAMAISVITGILTWLYAGSLALFQLLRFPMGISRGGSEPTNVAIVGEWWQKENRGFAVGVHHTGFPLGQFLGPVLMAIVLGVATWREVWLVIPLIGIPIIILQALIGTRKNQHKVYDWIERERLTVPLDAAEHEGRFQNPLDILRKAFSNRNTVLSIAMIFLFLWSELGVATFLTLYLTEVVHMPLTEAVIVSGASGITGWIGQVVWGSVSDHLGRKFALRIIILGWIVSVLLMMAITSVASAWIILLFWGIFRNSPFPVTYALLIDSVGSAAGSGMGLMIGIALGISGLVVAPVAGYFIQTWGWTADYIMLAVASALTLVPLMLLKETVVRPAAAPAGEIPSA